MSITSLSRRTPRYRAWTAPLSLTCKISTNWHKRVEPRIVTPPENFNERDPASGGLARHLGLFGTTMAVMGGIIGAGIFINPYLVAERVHTPFLILAAWIAGGVVALLGGFIYAELAARLPVVGGQYAYLREALHPSVAFLYGWVLLLVIQTGGMAAVAVTFARYFLELTHWSVGDFPVAAAALALLTAINCFGVRAGSRVQSAMTLTAIAAIGLLELFSFFRGGQAQISFRPILGEPPSLKLALAFGSAMTPVLFAYGGWQTSSFLGGEVRDPRKNASPRTHPWRSRRHRRLHFVEFFLRPRARTPGTRRHHHSSLHRHARRPRLPWRRNHRRGHRFLCFWFSCAVHADRSPRLFRHG